MDQLLKVILLLSEFLKPRARPPISSFKCVETILMCNHRDDFALFYRQPSLSSDVNIEVSMNRNFFFVQIYSAPIQSNSCSSEFGFIKLLSLTPIGINLSLCQAGKRINTLMPFSLRRLYLYFLLVFLVRCLQIYSFGVTNHSINAELEGTS